MKYTRYIILIMIFIGIVIYFNRQWAIEKTISNNHLTNNIVFEGIITNLQRSNNHSFGVIELKVTKSNVKNFDKILERGIYPYRIKGNLAELYCTISIERKVGNLVKVISNERTIYYNSGKDNEEGSIYIMTDTYNVDFVKKNTIFK